jgi:AraC-like DNA-binding protein
LHVEKETVVRARSTSASSNVFLYRRLVQAKLFIDSHYDNAINIDNIADEAYCSKFHFIRLFKKIYGRTPYQYLTSVRIDHAKKLLANNMPVADACFSVGFESVSSFKALFKRSLGITAADYRARQQERKASIRQRPLQYIPGCFAYKNGYDKK